MFVLIYWYYNRRQRCLWLMTSIDDVDDGARKCVLSFTFLFYVIVFLYLYLSHFVQLQTTLIHSWLFHSFIFNIIHIYELLLWFSELIYTLLFVVFVIKCGYLSFKMVKVWERNTHTHSLISTHFIIISHNFASFGMQWRQSALDIKFQSSK